MRALVCKEYGPPSQLILDDLDDPKPSKGQILFKVKAAGINFPALLSIEGKYQVKTEPPFIPGNEASGIIEAVGEGVERFKPGDQVITMSKGGAFAEKCFSGPHFLYNSIFLQEDRRTLELQRLPLQHLLIISFDLVFY